MGGLTAAFALTAALVLAVALSLVAAGVWAWSASARARRQIARHAARVANVEAALRDTEYRYQLAASSENDGLWDWRLDTDQVFYSSRWKALIGFGDEFIGEAPDEWLERVHPDDIPDVKAGLQDHLEGRTRKLDVEHRILHRTGDWRWVSVRGLAARDDDGKAIRIAGWMSDTTSRRDAEEQLRHDAMHDPLTGLPNRALFTDRLEQLARGSRHCLSTGFAVLFLDLDRFKTVNDSLGHSVGDDLLIAVSRRLPRVLRAEDTLARMGGDEFTVLLRDVATVDDAEAAARRLVAALDAPFGIAGHDLFVTTSIGIALGETGQANPEDLLRGADAAMYQAKEAGGGRFQVFDDGMVERAVARLHRETELRTALDRGELTLHYQPVVHLETSTLVGLEALVRWKHPRGHLVPPGTFIPIAEETGLIVAIDRWVVREAVGQLARWRADGILGDHVTVSVNLSARDFARPDLAEEIQGVLEKAGLPPTALVLEITESTAMSDPQHAVEMATQLRHMGVGLALDDFGTGHSSLGWLRRLPVSAIKIDRSFVSGMVDGPDCTALVRVVTTLAQSFNADTIAEGIETEAQRQALEDLQCDYGQGWLFARAVPADEVPRLPMVTGVAEEALRA